MSTDERKNASQIIEYVFPDSKIPEEKYLAIYLDERDIIYRMAIENKSMEEVVKEVNERINKDIPIQQLCEDLNFEWSKMLDPLCQYMGENHIQIILNKGQYDEQVHVKKIKTKKPTIVINNKKKKPKEKKEVDNGQGINNKLIKTLKEKLKLPREILPQYDLKDDYYVSNYIEEIHGQIFTGDTQEEVDGKVEEYVFSRLKRVCRKIVGTNMYNVLKVNSEELREKSTFMRGQYGTDYDGTYMTKVGDAPIKYHQPFDLLFLETRITSSKIVCEPYHEHEKHKVDNKVFNVFPGFQAKYQEEMMVEEAEEICQPILDHIRKIMANNDDAVFANIFECIANVIRNPKNKNHTMPTIVGPQGVGKGIIFESFIQPLVFGYKLMTIVSGLDKVTEKFNGILEGKLFILIDESANFDKSGLSKKDMETLKQYITGKTIIIHKKGKDRIEMNNYLNFIHITNSSDGGLFLEGRARRFNLFPTTEEIQPDSYYEELAKSFTQEVADAFFTYCIKSKPLCSTKEIIETKERFNAIENSKAAGLLFFDQVFKTGEYVISKSIIKQVDDVIYITKEDLYQRYKIWWNETKNGSPWSQRQFNNRCSEVPYLFIDRVMKKDVIPVRCACIKVSKEMYDIIMLEDDINLFQYLEQKKTGNIPNRKTKDSVESVKKGKLSLDISSKKKN